jgi:hypothetical protein
LIRTILPTGSSAPNRFSTTVSPSRHTFEEASISCCVKTRPEVIFQSRISRNSGDTPCRIVLQFWFP